MIQITLRTLFISALTLILTINVLYATNTIYMIGGATTGMIDVDLAHSYFGFESIYTGLTSGNPMKPVMDNFSNYIRSCRQTIDDIKFIDNTQIFSGNPGLIILGILRAIWLAISIVVNYIWVIILTIVYWVMFVVYLVFSIGWFASFPTPLPTGLTTL